MPFDVKQFYSRVAHYVAAYFDIIIFLVSKYLEQMNDRENNVEFLCTKRLLRVLYSIQTLVEYNWCDGNRNTNINFNTIYRNGVDPKFS